MKSAKANRFKKLSSFLTRKAFNGFTKSDLLIHHWGQQIASLSNMAEGIANYCVSGKTSVEEAVPLLDNCIKFAIHPRINPYRMPWYKIRYLGKWGYYLEHLNIILGSYERIAKDGKYHQMNTWISEHLVENSLRYDNAHADLHQRSRMKWPADQSAILYSIWLYDQNFGSNLFHEPFVKWHNYMENEGIDPQTGLYITEVMGIKDFSNVPRGCSISYLCHYLGRFNRQLADKMWANYKRYFWKSFGYPGGFREWHKESPIKKLYTFDSGPVLFGIGVAATGLGLNASSTVEDRKVYKKLLALMQPVRSSLLGIEKLVGDSIFTRIGTDMLATSIWFNAETKVSWFDDQQKRRKEQSQPLFASQVY